MSKHLIHIHIRGMKEDASRAYNKLLSALKVLEEEEAEKYFELTYQDMISFYHRASQFWIRVEKIKELIEENRLEAEYYKRLEEKRSAYSMETTTKEGETTSETVQADGQTIETPAGESGQNETEGDSHQASKEEG